MNARARHSQRGIALLTAIVLVAIATVLATAIAFASAMSARRASTVFGADQALLAAEGAEAMAAYVLRQSGVNQTEVALNQPWAQTYGPFELMPGITLDFLQLEDQQSKFNINNLAPGGASNAAATAAFSKLLTAVAWKPNGRRCWPTGLTATSSRISPMAPRTVSIWASRRPIARRICR